MSPGTSTYLELSLLCSAIKGNKVAWHLPGVEGKVNNQCYQL